MPANVAAFAEGLDVPEDDVLLYLALREAAHQRLFAGVPWLRDHLIGAVTDYAQGIEINTDGIQEPMEEQLRGVDPTNPEAMQELHRGRALRHARSRPQQEAALQRLEITLALVEGWVDEVVGQATAERMPTAAKLQEAVRRRRAAGGPAEETFASLVGLELRPAPAARRLHAVGLAAHPPGRRGPRRRLDEPRPAADRRRPRRPARASARAPTRPRSSARTTSTPSCATCSTAASAARRRPADGPDADVSAARRRARRARAAGPRPTPAQEALRDRYVAHLERAPRRAEPRLLPRPPHRRHAGARAPTATRCCSTCTRKARRWFAFGGHFEPGDATLAGAALREAAEESGIADLDARPGAGRTSTSTRCAFCDPRGDVHHLDVRFVARRSGRTPTHAVSDESLDVRWWPLDGAARPRAGRCTLLEPRRALGRRAPSALSRRRRRAAARAWRAAE